MIIGKTLPVGICGAEYIAYIYDDTIRIEMPAEYWRTSFLPSSSVEIRDPQVIEAITEAIKEGRYADVWETILKWKKSHE